MIRDSGTASSAGAAQTLKALAPGGRLVTVGNLETGIVDLNSGLVIVKELEILGAGRLVLAPVH